MRRRKRLARWASLPLVTVAWSACQRPQLVVSIDTDAPLLAQVLDPLRGDLSPAAAVDMVRVDVLDETDKVADFCEVVAADPAAWPITFGLLRPARGKARLRVRAFSRASGRPGTQFQLPARCGVGWTAATPTVVIEAVPYAYIERVVDLVFPELVSAKAHIQLSLACMGAQQAGRTCIGPERRSAMLDEGVTLLPEDSTPPTQAGRSPLARELSCQGLRPPPGRDVVCIPGGFTILGEVGAAGVDDLALDPVPLRPVHISPFFLDRHEFTVGEWRDLVASRRLQGTPLPPDPSKPGLHSFCVFTDTADRDLPVNCATHEQAQDACGAVGGSLPTEAQWEHAARGRGQGLRYPWGHAPPTCCTASLSRDSMFGEDHQCAGQGPQPLGQAAPGCPTRSDISRDGVVDMGGSMAEFMEDSMGNYEAVARCWGGEPGVAMDPVCRSTSVMSFVSRGGDWSAGLGRARSALRSFGVSGGAAGHVIGFRCAYAGGAS